MSTPESHPCQICLEPVVLGAPGTVIVIEQRAAIGFGASDDAMLGIRFPAHEACAASLGAGYKIEA